MKIGIITPYGLHNIGNRLQNFAVQEILRARGFETETIIYSRKPDYNTLSWRLRTLIGNILIKTGINTTDFYIKTLKKDIRTELFRDFEKNNVKTTTKYLFKANKMNKMKSCSREFDYFCAGSDQVWNPKLVQNNGFFFLSFAEPNKTFSFAASMGNINIPEQYSETFTNGFNHISNISVREEDLKTLAESITGREATLLLDPTLLLPRETWQRVSVKPRRESEGKYIATYFLSPPTASQKRFIEKYAEENRLDIIDMCGDNVGPAEFVYAVNNAEFVFTDSFHGTAFSILFEKNFVVFQRNYTADMSSRITTVLKKFKKEQRFFNCNNENIDEALLSRLIDDIKNEDMSYVQAIIKEEKQKASDFLNKVFCQE